ncbi:hypothetical protein ACLNAR_26620 [Priestia aryabhattai]|uniref:hypothetical protein n=1 Tax=Priestia aryabhattai TaxID=412384 RepID=UPI00398E3203
MQDMQDILETYDTPDMHGFIFLGDLINLEESEESIEIIDNHFLRRAKGEEIDHIKRELDLLVDSRLMITRHESIYKKDGSLNNLRRDHWNYWIIKVDKFESDTNPFYDAISLCSKDLNRLFDCVGFGDRGTTGRRFKPNIFYNFLEEVWIDNYTKSFSKKDAKEIHELHKLLSAFKAIEGNYSSIRKALQDFRMLKVVPRKTPFFFVSMFSIIESLIAHNPTSESKSISHQLATKLFLLNRRFEEPMVLDNYFKNPASFEKTIKLLYTYRSDIAHGNSVNFDKLQAIEGKEKASDFLYQLLKNIIIQSLREPNLITDLKSV